jgi:PAS domain-containing protein
VEIPFLSKKGPGSLNARSPGHKASIKDGTLISTDLGGKVTGVKGKPGAFDLPGSVIGRNVGEIFPNSGLPAKIRGMISSGAGVEDFRKLVNGDWGVLGVCEYVNGRLTYDAVLKSNGGLRCARIVERGLVGDDGKITGFNLILSDAGDEYRLGASKGGPGVFEPGEAVEDLLRATGSVLIHTDPHGTVAAISYASPLFGLNKGMIGRDIGGLYANQKLPAMIRRMLSEGAGLDAVKGLADSEWGLLCVFGLSEDGRLTYDAAVKADGGLFIARVVDRAVRDGAGRVIGFRMSMADVTENYQLAHQLNISERRLDELSARISEVVYLRDREGNVTYVSRSAENVLGIPCEKLLIPLSEWPIRCSQNIAPHEANAFACEYSGADGVYRRFDVSESYFTDEAGGVLAVMGVLKEVSAISGLKGH